jgi:hypothetical protein
MMLSQSYNLKHSPESERQLTLDIARSLCYTCSVALDPLRSQARALASSLDVASYDSALEMPDRVALGGASCAKQRLQEGRVSHHYELSTASQPD